MAGTAVESKVDGPTVGTTGVKIRDVVMRYRSGGSDFTLLDIASLEIPQKRCVGLSGPSGSGKTTLLNLCAGLLQPTSGTITVGDVDITALSQAARDRFRAEHIGYVFQGFNLVPALTAQGNVELALRLRGTPRGRERRALAERLLERVGLKDRLRLRPAQLSFGQMQRVGIARAVANRPRLLLADEPTASLEPGLARSIVELLKDVARENGATLLLASHDPAVLHMMEEQIAIADINRAERGRA